MLMVIYILAISLITAYYIIDYKNAENYDIQYKKIMNYFIYNSSDIDDINNNDINRNPTFEL